MSYGYTRGNKQVQTMTANTVVEIMRAAFHSGYMTHAHSQGITADPAVIEELFQRYIGKAEPNANTPASDTKS
jgi:hypothetical protein